jgi:RNA polymerase sigma-70 factor (ECF subfamily)
MTSRATTAARANPGGVPISMPPDGPPPFEEIYETQFAYVWRTLRAFGVPEHRLDDAVQDVFVVVHRKLALFQGRATIETWLFAIARRVAQDHRRSARRKDVGEELGDELVDASLESPFDATSRAESARLLTALLDELDDDKRAAFVLVELEQRPVPEAAAMLGENVNTIYSRLRAARQQFERAAARRGVQTARRNP